jgi:HK97 family phage major capsid protein
MPAPAANEKTVYFGDFSKFVLRDVNNMTMLRLVERGAEYLQVWFLMFHRHDSILLDAGTNPIKYLAQAAG